MQSDGRWLGRSALFFLVVTVALTWPMAAAPGALYSSRQDEFLGLWNLWWVARALAEPGRALFHTDLLLFPQGTGLEVQDLSLLQSVPAAPLTLALGPLVACNLLALASFWFAGWMTALWVRELTGSGLGACVAGVVFSFSPYHFTYLPELNLLPVGVIPLYLLCVLFLERRASVPRALAAGAALAAAGLASWYYGLAAGLLGLVFSARRMFDRSADAGRGAGHRARIELVHWGTCALLLAPVVARMAAGFIGKEFSAPVAEREGLALVMPEFKGTSYTVWLHAYVGIAALFLAVLGCLSLRRALPAIALTLLSLVLALGHSVAIGGTEIPLPFALLERLPLLGSARYPDRFFVLTQLGLAFLACLGAARLVDRPGLRARGRALLGGALLLVLLLEYAPLGLPSSPGLPDTLVPGADQEPAGAVFHVPTRIRSRDGEQMLLQLVHGRPIAGAYLTRRDEQLFRRLSEDPVLGALLGSTPRALPADLGRGLRVLGFSFVSVQKQPLFPGTSMVDGRIALSFRLGGRGYWEQRLFPGYQPPAEVAALARAWIQALTPVLGPPVRETPQEALFLVAEG